MTVNDRVKYWRNKIKENADFIQIQYRVTTIPSVYCLEATAPDFPFPLGNVWYRWNGNATIEILYSFVPEAYRKCGIRTKIHNYMLSNWDKKQLVRIITAAGTKEGEPWLKKRGFKQERKTEDWVLER